MSKFIYTKDKPLRVCTLCSGYDSQCMAGIFRNAFSTEEVESMTLF